MKVSHVPVSGTSRKCHSHHFSSRFYSAAKRWVFALEVRVTRTSTVD